MSIIEFAEISRLECNYLMGNRRCSELVSGQSHDASGDSWMDVGSRFVNCPSVWSSSHWVAWSPFVLSRFVGITWAGSAREKVLLQIFIVAHIVVVLLSALIISANHSIILCSRLLRSSLILSGTIRVGVDSYCDISACFVFGWGLGGSGDSACKCNEFHLYNIKNI